MNTKSTFEYRLNSTVFWSTNVSSGAADVTWSVVVFGYMTVNEHVCG